MFRYLVLLTIALSSFNSLAEVKSQEIDDLKNKVAELEEIQKETSEILKRQLADQHFDQSSRGYIELKFGVSKFSPDDIEDENDELFKQLNDASWEKFGYAGILDLEIGKTIQDTDSSRHEIGIGYQQLRSSVEGSFTPTGGETKVFETVSIHTLFVRYLRLFRMDPSNKMYMGPGLTLGYSPVSKLIMQVEQGNEGAQISAEGTSYLIELFGKAKYEISRYVSLVAMAGYRIQEAENLRLIAAEIVSVKTKTNLDASGPFATLGLAVAF